jgi:hypothetical protein
MACSASFGAAAKSRLCGLSVFVELLLPGFVSGLVCCGVKRIKPVAVVLLAAFAKAV